MPSKPLLLHGDWLPVAGWLVVALPVTTAIGPAVIDIACSLVALVFLAQATRDQKWDWLQETWVRVIFALWAYTVLRAVLAGRPWVNVGLALSWIRYPLLVVAMATWILPHAVWRERLLWATAGVCGFLGLDALFQAAVGFDIIGRPIYQERLTATMARPRLGITLAWLFLPAVFGVLQRAWTRTAVGLALLCLSVILLSGDRLAFLFATAGLALVGVSLPAVRRHIWKFGLVAALTLGTLLVVKPDVYSRQVTSTLNAFRNVGATHYGIIWQRGLTIAAANPVFGVGLNHYRDVCERPQYGPVVQARPSETACAQHPHNLYLEWLVEGGLVGCAGFIAALLLLMRHAIRAWPTLRTDYVFVALLVTAGLRLFPASTATSLTRSWFAMPLWLVVGWALALAMAAAPAQAKADR